MIRLCRLTSGLASQLASLLGNGEASTCKYGRPVELRGSVCRGGFQTRLYSRGATEWLTMEWSERPCTWTGETCPRAMAEFMPASRRAARAGVRGSIVVKKRCNGRGAKGARKVDT